MRTQVPTLLLAVVAFAVGCRGLDWPQWPTGDDQTTQEYDAEVGDELSPESDEEPDIELDTEADPSTDADSDADADTDTGPCQGAEFPDVEWVSIPGGNFEMGDDDPIVFDRTKPVHQVSVPDFELARTEVTVWQYRRCVDAGACSEPDTGPYCNWGVSCRDNHPVNCLDWTQARAFSAWKGGRLPSEAEWEYAARSGGQDRNYPWGDERATCDYAVMALNSDFSGEGCGQYSTHAACSIPAGNTDQGLCDMAGNVDEWVEDDWHLDYTGAPGDSDPWVDHPRASWRVVRGGSWLDSARYLRASMRGSLDPARRSTMMGFRPAR